MDAHGYHHRRDQDRNLHRRSSSAALPYLVWGTESKIRHRYAKYAKGTLRQTFSPKGTAMDGIEWRFVDANLDQLPPELDDDEIISVGEPIWHVIKVEVIAPLTLFVEFEDGVKGKVRFAESYLQNIWAKLRNPVYFAQVGIAYGAVSWPNEEPDMCPSTMYDEIVRHKDEWVLR